MADISFLKLYLNDFNSAVINENIAGNDDPYTGFVQMLPTETFLQITNCDSDIAFGGSLQVDLINICQEVVKSLEVNENFFYVEGTDLNGTKQIAFEFGNLGDDYYDDILFLRLQHLMSDKVWFSSGFLITDKLIHETTRKEYKNESYFKGVDYNVFPYFQTIRTTCFQSDINPSTESEEQTKLSGAKKWLREITTPMAKFIFYVIDIFTFNRILAVLSHDIVYINGIRHNTTAQNLNKGEKDVNWNLFDASFETNPTEEKSPVGYQIYQPLLCVGKSPHGTYTLAGYNSVTGNSVQFSLGFNKNVIITTDITLLVYKDNVLFATFDYSKFSVSGQVINIDVSAHPITANGNYQLIIQPNKVIHNIDFWQGFNFGEWIFSIVPEIAFYNPSFYNPTKYNT